MFQYYGESKMISEWLRPEWERGRNSEEMKRDRGLVRKLGWRKGKKEC